MQLTVRLFGLEFFHVELCESDEAGEDVPADRGYLTAAPVGFTPSPGDQRWEKPVREEDWGEDE
jgi:hypothetical protein